MPLFRRRPTEPTVVRHGRLPCSEAGCSNNNAVTCEYRDRRGNACESTFCPQHWAEVNDGVYCRRHASTMEAFGSSVDTTTLPDLDNRGPSLVRWVADELNDEIEALLRSVARPDETVRTETEVLVYIDHNHRRRWERGWKLLEATGISLKVALTVTEGDDDALVEVRVGSNVIARGVPPWIARRRAGLESAGAVDRDQRELFHRFFMNHIAEEVAEQRAAARSGRVRV